MIVADLLISDKSSVSSCISVFVLTLIDFHSAIPSWTSWLMSQLITRLAGQDSGERHMKEEAHVHVAVHVGEGLTTAHSWDREVLCPLDLDSYYGVST